MVRKYNDYIDDILKECSYLINRSKDISFNELLSNDDIQRAFVRSLEIIGEAVKKIPADILDSAPEIDWHAVAGMRNILIHEYFGVDYKVIWETIQKDVPQLHSAITKIKANLK